MELIFKFNRNQKAKSENHRFVNMAGTATLPESYKIAKIVITSRLDVSGDKEAPKPLFSKRFRVA